MEYQNEHIYYKSLRKDLIEVRMKLNNLATKFSEAADKHLYDSQELKEDAIGAFNICHYQSQLLKELEEDLFERLY